MTTLGSHTSDTRAAKWPSVAGVVVFTLAGWLTSSGVARADAVRDWNAIAVTVSAVNLGRTPAAVTADVAYVHIAIYDALTSIDGRYAPFAVTPAFTSPNASPDAAVAAAAYTVLAAKFPSQLAYLDPRYASALAAIPNGPAKTDGVAIGTEVANTLLTQRASDGWNAAVPYVFQSGPGQYQRTPPAFPDPAAPWVARMQPFGIVTPWQFRAMPPPSLDSAQWATDYNEVKLYGDVNSTVRTAGETEIGRFYQEHGAIQFARNLRQFSAGLGLSPADNARLFAQLYVTQADALIACWDSKYFYNFWRPVTAIRAGDTDGNADTDIDPDWSSLIPTPNHPEYPAAHGCFTASYAEGLADFFGTKDVSITLTSTVTNTQRVFTRTDQLIKEIVDARVFGGVHYRTSSVHGVVIGRKVAHWISKHYFQPLD